MNKLNFYCHSEMEQAALGACLARACAGKPLLIFLQGDLGAGKTTLVRGYLRAMGYEGPVRSPTYTLVEPYALGEVTVFHLDLYRLCDPEELEFLGGREIFSGQHQVLVEWPEKGDAWLPEPDLLLHLEHRPDGRGVTMEGNNALIVQIAVACAGIEDNE